MNISINHARIVALIWGIADDVLRDLYVRGKYRDVILPFTVLRRLDSVLEPTRDAVIEMKKTLDDAGIANQDGPLRSAAQQDFYNTSAHAKRLTCTANLTRLRQNLRHRRVLHPSEIIDNPRVCNHCRLTKGAWFTH